MSADLLLWLPIACPLVGLALCVMWLRAPAVQRLISLLANIGLLLSSLLVLDAVQDGTILVTQFGSWRAPFGVSFVADMLSSAMVVITGIMAVAVGVYEASSARRERRSAFFYPLYQGLLLGVAGAFLTGDIFNLYIWFEIMLISSFGMLVVEGTKEQYDAGVKYVVLNLVATTLFLLAVSYLYAATGRLNLADLARALPDLENQGLVATLAVLFFLVFGCKAAIFPLFFWLPAAYHTALAPVAAIFAALLTKVGVYAIIRTTTLLFDADAALMQPLIGWAAAATMLFGVLGAAAHYDVRRILSFHIISQIGYMLLGLAIGTPRALAGAVLYIIHHIIVKANLFLLAGVIERASGSPDLKRIGGLYARRPGLAVLFLVPAMSLAGIPPLSGFWSKFVVIQAAIQEGHVAFAAIGLAVGALTLYSMIKIWSEAFWKAVPPASEPTLAAFERDRVGALGLMLPCAVLALLTLAIGLGVETVFDFSSRAGEQLLDKARYIEAVLPGHSEDAVAARGGAQ
jgi:multicomponent Na+:H+ antiporter subunit D